MAERSDDTRRVLSTPEARQGLTGLNVRYVLVIALAAVILSFGAIYIFFFNHGI